MGYQCAECLKEFPSKQEYDRHMNRKKPCGQGEYCCQGCNQTYTSKRSLQIHQRTTCKGKNTAQQALELTRENESLKSRLELQQQLPVEDENVSDVASSSSLGAQMQLLHDSSVSIIDQPDFFRLWWQANPENI